MKPTRLLALLLALPLLHCSSADFTVADPLTVAPPPDTGATDADGAERSEATGDDAEAPPLDSGGPTEAGELDADAGAPDTASPPLDTTPTDPDTGVAPDTAAPPLDTGVAPDTAPALDTAPATDAGGGVPCVHCAGGTGICPSATLDTWCWDSICHQKSTCYFTTSNVCHCGV